jgi:hypothetical protein
MKSSRATQPRPTLDPALVELARFVAWCAVEDYLAELKRSSLSDDVATTGEHQNNDSESCRF